MRVGTYPVRGAVGLQSVLDRAQIMFILRTALVGLIVVSLLVLMVVPDSEAVGGPSEAVPHVVRSGESLWSIAVAYTPETGDVRETLTFIRDVNGLSSDVVLIGDAIAVPIGMRTRRPGAEQ